LRGRRMGPKQIAFAGKFGFAALLSMAVVVLAQTADQAWLRDAGARARISIRLEVRALGNSPLEQSAERELERGIAGYGAGSAAPKNDASHGEIVLGTVAEVRAAFPRLQAPGDLGPQGYWIQESNSESSPRLVVAGADERGVLYGAFALLRALGEGKKLEGFAERSSPAMAVRWVDEWDNADGSIERGYAGRSIFFEGGKVRDDLAPVAEYARLLASVGINGCNVNNVNGSSAFLEPDMIAGLKRVADTMRPWGVRLAISVDVASPQKVGGMASYDPLDPAVKAWWRKKVDAIYAQIPDFAGFTVKADSEGQPGPASYGRTPADAANTLAEALAPHGGVVLYRAFVYNHHLDWNDPKADRARAAYDIFHPLDGKFAPNVIVQTKEGPIDFQVREPVSPLFGGLTQTRQAMEVQITQEYLGQQRHLVYIAPMWKEVLDFDMRVNGRSTPVKAILAGTAFDGGRSQTSGSSDPSRPRADSVQDEKLGQGSGGGMVGVAGVGREGWLGSPLAMANLYAFGRLAWDPNLEPEKIAEEWAQLTLLSDPDAAVASGDIHRVVAMLMRSWPTYESYTGPLGLQTLTDITGSHYGPNIEASENNGWGQWHRADHDGVGMDRTVATGTGFVGQYWPEVAKMYESASTTPDNLLLFFHHVPYTYKLHDGKTVIQYLYDSHYAGAAEVAEFVRDWETLKGRIDPAIYNNMHARLEYQEGHAIVWRDAVVQYFLKLSGIPDERGRAGHFLGRMEAEDARLTGYTVVDVTPWEDASRGKAVECAATEGTTSRSCSAEWTYDGAADRFDIAVEYFDLQGGVARFSLDVNGNPAASWDADAEFPSRQLHGDNSVRHTVRGVALKPGDVLRVEGTPDGKDPAALDYIELAPAANPPN
jgi:alpha-glucuronidase